MKKENLSIFMIKIKKLRKIIKEFLSKIKLEISIKIFKFFNQ